MEASAAMVAGCHKKKELVRIRHDSSDSGPKPLKDLNGKVCQICEDNVGLTATGDVFASISVMSGEIPHATPDTESDREGEPSQLPPVDIFVSTVDPLEEPPIVTANTVLSILAVDYPVDKVSCYVNDEGSAMLTFEALSETVEIAKKWVPFCKKHNIKPRAPESYFSKKINYLKDKVQPSFVKERRAMKREYDEFKVNINALVYKAQKSKTPKEGWTMQDGTLWPGNNPRDHPGMIQVFLGNELPRLVYVSREKRPGFQHHEEAGAMNALIRVSAVLTNGAYFLNVDYDRYFNNSKALKEAMCFKTGPLYRKKTCYVQFNQRFDGIDLYNPNANRKIVFYDGPAANMGTGCCFNRQLLYAYDPVLTEGVEGYDDERSLLMSQKSLEQLFGKSSAFIASTFMERGGIPPSTNPATLLREAIDVISCGYEDKTEWGKKIGWLYYGSATEDISTEFKMHARDRIWLLRGAFFTLVFIYFLNQQFGTFK